MRRLTTCVLALALTFIQRAPAPAATIVLDAGTGAVHDAIGDGWLFAGAPTVAPDGVGDAGGNGPGVGRRSGQAAANLELRSISEYPLSALSGVGPGDIESAMLTFYVDDVIGTFGPGGADFDNTASDRFVLFGYTGNGTVDLADFGNVAGAPLAIVNTSATPGSITDATLAVSGPLRFDVDVTALVQSLLTSAAPALGLVFTTDDNLTATSIDGLSPPGVPGATLPFIAVTTIEAAPPVLTNAAQTCQVGLGKAAAKFGFAKGKAFAICLGAVLKDFAPDATVGPATVTKCGKQLDETNPDSKLAKATVKFQTMVATKCEGLGPADIASPCNGDATTLDEIAACILAAEEAAVETQIRLQYTGACSMLEAVGLAIQFEGVCGS